MSNPIPTGFQEELFNKVKSLFIRSLQHAEIERVSTDITIKNRPDLSCGGNAIDYFCFSHNLVFMLRSEDFEANIPLILTLKQECLLDIPDKHLRGLNIVNSGCKISTNQDLYEEGGYSITLFNSNLVELFNKMLGFNEKNGFVKGEVFDFDFGQHLKRLDNTNPSIIFFDRLTEEINDLLYAPVTCESFKLLTEFVKHNREGTSEAMASFSEFFALTSL